VGLDLVGGSSSSFAARIMPRYGKILAMLPGYRINRIRGNQFPPRGTTRLEAVSPPVSYLSEVLAPKTRSERSPRFYAGNFFSCCLMEPGERKLLASRFARNF